MANDFLPISYEDIKKHGWDYYDFLYIIGDAYVDHPSFGPSIISRVLENAGYRVAILSQPDYTTCDELVAFTRPRLGVLISSGNLDSMVNHYTASKKPRSTDNYSEGGKMGKRPDRAVIVYSNLARQAFGDIPVIIGGVEASLRRFAHYDYWQNKVRRSVLVDSKANLLIYGMGETPIVEIADRLNSGTPVKEITDIAGTCYITSNIGEIAKDAVFAPSFEEVRDDKKEYAKAHKIQYDEQDPVRGKTVIQPHHDRFLVQNKPSMPLSEKQLDKVYSLPYMRTYHPIYKEGVPAISEVKFSITSCRGCYGACNFCALTFHQGRIVTSRSHKSIIAEAQKITQDTDFKGYIHDVGGPTANFRKSACKKQLTHGACKDKRCLAPTPCPNLEVDHTDYIKLLDKLRQLPGIKKVFVRSGVRFDYAIYDKSDAFLKTLCAHHVSGQLKVAPEHISDNVLKYMGKPSVNVFDKFKDKYYKINKELGKEQYLVPYLMSSHPGSTLADAIDLAVYLKKNNLRPEQVQDFYPTPGTTSTCMFYTGLDPYTGKSVYVPKSPHEKAMQRALMQFFVTDNYDLVYEALTKTGRRDLIGHGENCLIWPKINKTNKPTNKGGKNKTNSRIKENNRHDDSGRKKGITKNKGRVKNSGRRNEKRGH